MKTSCSFQFCRVIAIWVCLKMALASGGQGGDGTNEPIKILTNGVIPLTEKAAPVKVRSSAEGFQLSLAFTKESFTNGEPIFCFVTIRNITNQFVGYYDNVHAYKEVVVVNDAGQTLISKEQLRKTPFERSLSRIVMNPQPFYLGAGAQRTYTNRLNDMYELNLPGQYLVYAKQIVPTPDWKSRVELVSDSVSITIVGTNAIPNTGHK